MTVRDSYRGGAKARKSLTCAQITTICGGKLIAAQSLNAIDRITTPDRLLPNSAIFIDRFDKDITAALAKTADRNVLVIAGEEYRDAIPQPRLITQHPRSAFAALISALFEYRVGVQTCAIAESAKIDASARLSPGVVVGHESVIGPDCYIYPNVTIGDRVRIGSCCVVKSGSVIGQPGFRVYRDAHNLPQQFPHVGGVVIEDYVEIGSLNTVCAGTIHPTVIEAHVKTDDQVHIAHNCHIGERTLITACAEVSGSVRVGADCWIGPNVSVRDGVQIGEGAFVGIGANVISSVEPHTTVIGNPARPHGDAKS